MSSDNDHQGRLFDPKRFSPLQLSVWVRLPGDRTRTLVIASAIGRGIRRDSSFAPFRSGMDVIGVYVSPKDKATILKVARLHERDWRRDAQSWERLGIAHRCGRGHVTLFVAAGQSSCPNPTCGLDMPDIRSASERWGLRTSEPLSTGHLDPYGEDISTPISVPISGNAVNGGGDTTSSTDEGEATDAALRTSEPLSNLAYGQEYVCTCGHGFTMHFIAGRCRRPACDCQEPVRIAQEAK